MTYIVSAFSSLMGFLAADGQKVMFRCVGEGETCLERKRREGKGWRLFHSEALPRAWAVGGNSFARLEQRYYPLTSTLSGPKAQ